MTTSTQTTTAVTVFWDENGLLAGAACGVWNVSIESMIVVVDVSPANVDVAFRFHNFFFSRRKSKQIGYCKKVVFYLAPCLIFNYFYVAHASRTGTNVVYV